MSQISRLKDAEISNGNIINADDIDAELNDIISESNAQDTRITAVESGTYTFSGVKTFSSTPKMNAIDERTAASGVTIDSVVLKDGFVRVPAGADFTPTTNGDFGYDSTSHTYDVYVNGSAKSLLHTGSNIDDLNDVTITTPASGQGLKYDGAGWVNGSVGNLTLIDSEAISGSPATVDMETLDSTYDEIWFQLIDLRPGTDDRALQIQVKDSTYQSDAGDYSYIAWQMRDNSIESFENSASATFIRMTEAGGGAVAPGNASGESLSGWVTLYKPSGSTYKKFVWTLSYEMGDGNLVYMAGSGRYKGSTNAITGVRFAWDTGNHGSGTIRMWGRNNS